MKRKIIGIYILLFLTHSRAQENLPGFCFVNDLNTTCTEPAIEDAVSLEGSMPANNAPMMLNSTSKRATYKSPGEKSYFGYSNRIENSLYPCLALNSFVAFNKLTSEYARFKTGTHINETLLTGVCVGTAFAFLAPAVFKYLKKNKQRKLENKMEQIPLAAYPKK